MQGRQAATDEWAHSCACRTNAAPARRQCARTASHPPAGWEVLLSDPQVSRSERRHRSRERDADRRTSLRTARARGGVEVLAVLLAVFLLIANLLASETADEPAIPQDATAGRLSDEA